MPGGYYTRPPRPSRGPSTTKGPMMLAERLEAIRQGADKRIPPGKRATQRATADLRASGIMDRVIKVGDPLPPFTLKNASGQEIRSADLLATSPLGLTCSAAAGDPIASQSCMLCSK